MNTATQKDCFGDTITLSVGSTVDVETWGGDVDSNRIVTSIDFDEGRDSWTIAYIASDGGSCWAYFDQVINTR